MQFQTCGVTCKQCFFFCGHDIFPEVFQCVDGCQNSSPLTFGSKRAMEKTTAVENLEDSQPAWDDATIEYLFFLKKKYIYTYILYKNHMREQKGAGE